MPTLPVHQGCCSSQVEHVLGVVLLLRQVLVAQDALGVAAAAHVDADAAIAVAGEVAVARVVGGERGVVLAVRDVLEDRRHRIARRQSSGSHSARRQPDAVAHRDPDVAQHAHRLRQLVDALHPAAILAGGGGGCTPFATALRRHAQRPLRSPAPRGSRRRIASSTRRGARASPIARTGSERARSSRTRPSAGVCGVAWTTAPPWRTSRVPS